MLSISNVTAIDPHTSRPVLDGFGLAMAKGELVVLLGGGGSGKTTLMELLIGARKPSNGDVIVNDISVPNLRSGALTRYRRSIGIAMQTALLEHRSVEAHVALPLEVDGIGTPRRHDRVEAILERFALAHVRTKRPAMLSMSERQRTAIATAVAREPIMLFADEPAAHLDASAAKDIAQIFLREHLRGMTMLIATSNEQFAGYFPKENIRTM